MPARVMIVVTSLMTINTITATAEKKLPKTSYIKVSKMISDRDKE